MPMIAGGDWALALLVASNCGQEKYQEVCRAYATASLPLHSPLHLASMMFSNQAVAALQHGGRRLLSQSQQPHQQAGISTLWRRNLAMVRALSIPLLEREHDIHPYLRNVIPSKRLTDTVEQAR
jgi:hypothetical protein